MEESPRRQCVVPFFHVLSSSTLLSPLPLPHFPFPVASFLVSLAVAMLSGVDARFSTTVS